jgi:hypothetical protein
MRQVRAWQLLSNISEEVGEWGLPACGLGMLSFPSGTSGVNTGIRKAVVQNDQVQPFQ